MSQQHVKFGDYTPPDVDEDGYQPQLATTSSEKSGRTMKGGMMNTPLFTVEAYSLKWTDIKATDVANILSRVVGRSSFSFYHFNVYKAKWETGEFYAANYNTPVASLEEGKEKYDELSFQVTGINPLQL